MGAQVAHVPPRSLTRPTRPSYDHQHNVLLPPRSRPHTFALARARALHHTPHDQNHTYADRATTSSQASESSDAPTTRCTSQADAHSPSPTAAAASSTETKPCERSSKTSTAHAFTRKKASTATMRPPRSSSPSPTKTGTRRNTTSALSTTTGTQPPST